MGSVYEDRPDLDPKNIVKLTPQEIEEKWATQDFHIYRPKSHEAVEAEWMYGDDSTAEEQLIEQEEKVVITKEMEDKLSQLTKREREVIELLYLGPSMTQKEAATILGLSQQRVSLLFNRATEKLKNLG